MPTHVRSLLQKRIIANMNIVYSTIINWHVLLKILDLFGPTLWGSLPDITKKTNVLILMLLVHVQD